MTHRLTTEESNERSLRIDEMNALEIVTLMNEEDETVAGALKQALPAVAKVVEAIVTRWKQGGRCFVIGAGTSGRLGILDAAELGPTFSIAQNRWIGLIAGGREAMWLPLEENEDDEEVVVQELKAHHLSAKDVVIGISASGSTPYVLAALRYAKTLDSLIVAISCNQGTAASQLSDCGIEVPVGPEVIRGSTRLKAGTAQKMVLNMLSTATMIRLGKVYQNQMVDMQLINEKLVGRAITTLKDILQVPADVAEALLEQSGHHLKTAIFMGMTGAPKEQALHYLEQAEGRLKEAVQSYLLK
jgi:N-acetylmuramic acid 6-phosphate etherase